MDKNIHGKLHQLAERIQCEWEWCRVCAGTGLVREQKGDPIIDCRICHGAGEALVSSKIDKDK